MWHVYLHDDTHRPHEPRSSMWRSDATQCQACEEESIVGAPYEATCVVGNGTLRIMWRRVSKVRDREERWHVGVVHQLVVAQSIDLRHATDSMMSAARYDATKLTSRTS